MERKINFVVKLQRPVCRTPIKPLQKHKNAVKYTRKKKWNSKVKELYEESL